MDQSLQDIYDEYLEFDGERIALYTVLQTATNAIVKLRQDLFMIESENTQLRESVIALENSKIDQETETTILTQRIETLERILNRLYPYSVPLNKEKG